MIAHGAADLGWVLQLWELTLGGSILPLFFGSYLYFPPSPAIPPDRAPVSTSVASRRGREMPQSWETIPSSFLLLPAPTLFPTSFALALPSLFHICPNLQPLVHTCVCWRAVGFNPGHSRNLDLLQCRPFWQVLASIFPQVCSSLRSISAQYSRSNSNLVFLQHPGVTGVCVNLLLFDQRNGVGIGIGTGRGEGGEGNVHWVVERCEGGVVFDAGSVE